MKYVALLRGINVGGKNKVAMSDLRACFEELGLTDVSTYINSGNIFFSSLDDDEMLLVKRCEAAIEKRFEFAVIVMVISARDLKNAIDAAPSWWADGTPNTRNDVLFVIPPVTSEEVLVQIQKKASTVDKLAARPHAVFWTLPMASYNKSVVPKIISTPIYQSMTMRSSTTAKKLYALLDEDERLA